MSKFMISLLLMATTILVKSQTANVRGMYVDGFSTILGNSVKEDSLLSYSRYNNFNYLALYGVPSSINSNSKMANFIQKAKQLYGIQQIGAVGESIDLFLSTITVYNKAHSNPLQKIDVYNVEFEFWNSSSASGNYWCKYYLKPDGYSCDTAGAFRFYDRLIHQVDSLAKADGALSELYVGWFNQSQGIEMGNSVDRILLHDYISNYSGLYSYVSTRMQYIGARKKVTEVILLLSAETTFLGPWLASHPLVQPYNDMVKKLNTLSSGWKDYINLNGYQWFAYTDLRAATFTTSIISVDNTLSFKVYPNPNSGVFTINQDIDRSAFLDIYNLLGYKVFSTVLTSDKTEIALGNQAKGIYFYKIRNEDETLKTGKIIIE